MKFALSLTLSCVFVVFLGSLLATTLCCLDMVWSVEPPSRQKLRLVGTFAIIMCASLFYVPVAEAMYRVSAADREHRDQTN